MTTEAKKSSILLQKAYFLGFSVAFHLLFVSSIDDPKQNVGSFLTPVFSMLFHMVPSVLLFMEALITTYFKESD